MKVILNKIVAYEAIGLDVLKHRANIIKNNDDFKNKITENSF